MRRYSPKKQVYFEPTDRYRYVHGYKRVSEEKTRILYSSDPRADRLHISFVTPTAPGGQLEISDIESGL